jgi:hypothetical protein
MLIDVHSAPIELGKDPVSLRPALSSLACLILMAAHHHLAGGVDRSRRRPSFAHSREGQASVLHLLLMSAGHLFGMEGT